MTPDFTDTITLGDDPFSGEYWDNHRVAPLLEAMRGVLAGDPDYTKYIAYWHTRCQGDDAEARRIGECYRMLAANIKANGYISNAWQHDGRDFDVTQGHGPMSVDIGNDGKLWPIDGSHRACILRLLGKSVNMWVWRRRPKWEKLKAFHKTLYTPYPHPDFAGHPVNRKGGDRFIAVLRALAGSAVTGAVVVGACTGYGAIGFANAGIRVQAFEPCNERRALMEMLASRSSGYERFGVRPTAAHEITTAYGWADVVVGMSVYQHVATTAERWALVCNHLAACRRHVIELPGNHEKQWHKQFREQSDGKPQEAIIKRLRWAGSYGPPEVIYTDYTYANRQTILLQRP